GAVVDRLVDAEVVQQVVLRRRRRADHVRAPRLRDLDREVPDPARGGVHEDALPRLHVGDVDQALPRGEPGERQAGRLDLGQARGAAGEVARRRRHELRVGARLAWEPRHPEHRVAHREAGDAPPDRVDRARDAPAHGERRRPEPAGVSQSTGFTPAAPTRTRTSVGRGSGISASPSSSTCGPPVDSCVITRIVPTADAYHRRRAPRGVEPASRADRAANGSPRAPGYPGSTAWVWVTRAASRPPASRSSVSATITVRPTLSGRAVAATWPAVT